MTTITPQGLALLDKLKRHLGDFTVKAIRSFDWQSLTFLGERHEIEFEPTPEQRKLLAAIGDVEFALPEAILADIGVAQLSDGKTVQLEALTVNA
jgi:hypothetical protein